MRRRVFCVLGMLVPGFVWAQDTTATGLSEDLKGLQPVLDSVRAHMMVHAGELAGTGRGVAGLGGLFFICYKGWKHLFNGEAIDFYPLLRPFALGIVLLFYTGFIADFEGVMKPTVDQTAALVT